MLPPMVCSLPRQKEFTALAHPCLLAYYWNLGLLSGLVRTEAPGGCCHLLTVAVSIHEVNMGFHQGPVDSVKERKRKISYFHELHETVGAF